MGQNAISGIHANGIAQGYSLNLTPDLLHYVEYLGIAVFQLKYSMEKFNGVFQRKISKEKFEGKNQRKI